MSRYVSVKPYALPSTLDELHGPTNGAVSLPTRLHWGPDNRYDFADDGEVAVMCERVVREAPKAQDLAGYLDAGLLRRLWPALVLPGEARATWGHRFRELRHEVAAA